MIALIGRHGVCVKDGAFAFTMKNRRHITSRTRRRRRAKICHWAASHSSTAFSSVNICPYAEAQLSALRRVSETTEFAPKSTGGISSYGSQSKIEDRNEDASAI